MIPPNITISKHLPAHLTKKWSLFKGYPPVICPEILRWCLFACTESVLAALALSGEMGFRNTILRPVNTMITAPRLLFSTWHWPLLLLHLLTPELEAWPSLAWEPDWFPRVLPSSGCSDEDATLLCTFWVAPVLLIATQAHTYPRFWDWAGYACIALSRPPTDRGVPTPHLTPRMYPRSLHPLEAYVSYHPSPQVLNTASES